jgi:ABC-2 type transport system ATP-binding protein
MQRAFLTLVREVRDAGQTVFLSSHDLSEVEQVADRVGILRRGRLVVVEEVATLKAHAVRRLDLTFDGVAPIDVLRRVPGIRVLAASGPSVHLAVEGSMAELMRAAAPYGMANVVSHEADLEEIFLTYYADETERQDRLDAGARA